MIEEAYTFGDGECLVGIITEPDSKGVGDGLPAVILWNAGLLHRVGPFRLYVDLARKLTSLGFLVFRFDLAGKGDSGVHMDTRLYEERAIGDVREAMDFLSKKRGVDKFVLIGLCSGADDAHSVAVVDSRVSGVIFLDAYGYRTLGFYARHYCPRLVRLTVWKRFLKQKYSSIVSRAHKGTHSSEREKVMFIREFPPKRKIIKDLTKLIKGGVNLLYIYSGGLKYAYYNYHGQFKDMFRAVDFKGKVQLEYFGDAGHTYPELGSRSNLISTICDWMVRNYTPSQEISVPRNTQELSKGFGHSARMGSAP